MKRRTQSGQQLSKEIAPSSSFRFICCECNALLSADEVRHRRPLIFECSKGHFACKRRAWGIALLQGFGCGTLFMMVAAAVALFDRNSTFAILGAAGAICSAFACKRMLDGMRYQRLPEPAKSLARQRFSEAVGVWMSIFVSSILTAH